MTLNHDILRWMYRERRPNWLARFLNRGSSMVASLGITPNYLVTLEVKGRKSGRISSFPVVIAVVDGQRYLVSMLGNEAQWVKNIHAGAGEAVIYSGHRENVRLVEVAIDQRAPILKAYLQRAPGARPHIPVNKDAAVADFEKIAADFPVFQIVAAKMQRSTC